MRQLYEQEQKNQATRQAQEINDFLTKNETALKTAAGQPDYDALKHALDDLRSKLSDVKNYKSLEAAFTNCNTTINTLTSQLEQKKNQETDPVRKKSLEDATNLLKNKKIGSLLDPKQLDALIAPQKDEYNTQLLISAWTEINGKTTEEAFKNINAIIPDKDNVIKQYTQRVAGLNNFKIHYNETDSTIIETIEVGDPKSKKEDVEKITPEQVAMAYKLKALTGGDAEVKLHPDLSKKTIDAAHRILASHIPPIGWASNSELTKRLLLDAALSGNVAGIVNNAALYAKTLPKLVKELKGKIKDKYAEVKQEVKDLNTHYSARYGADVDPLEVLIKAIIDTIRLALKALIAALKLLFKAVKLILKILAQPSLAILPSKPSAESLGHLLEKFKKEGIDTTDPSQVFERMRNIPYSSSYRDFYLKGLEKDFEKDPKLLASLFENVGKKRMDSKTGKMVDADSQYQERQINSLISHLVKCGLSEKALSQLPNDVINKRFSEISNKNISALLVASGKVKPPIFNPIDAWVKLQQDGALSQLNLNARQINELSLLKNIPDTQYPLVQSSQKKEEWHRISFFSPKLVKEIMRHKDFTTGAQLNNFINLLTSSQCKDISLGLLSNPPSKIDPYNSFCIEDNELQKILASKDIDEIVSWYNTLSTNDQTRVFAILPKDKQIAQKLSDLDDNTTKELLKKLNIQNGDLNLYVAGLSDTDRGLLKLSDNQMKQLHIHDPIDPTKPGTIIKYAKDFSDEMVRHIIKEKKSDFLAAPADFEKFVNNLTNAQLKNFSLSSDWDLLKTLPPTSQALKNIMAALPADKIDDAFCIWFTKLPTAEQQRIAALLSTEDQFKALFKNKNLTSAEHFTILEANQDDKLRKAGLSELKQADFVSLFKQNVQNSKLLDLIVDHMWDKDIKKLTKPEIIAKVNNISDISLRKLITLQSQNLKNLTEDNLALATRVALLVPVPAPHNSKTIITDALVWYCNQNNGSLVNSKFPTDFLALPTTQQKQEVAKNLSDDELKKLTKDNPAMLNAMYGVLDNTKINALLLNADDNKTLVPLFQNKPVNPQFLTELNAVDTPKGRKWLIFDRLPSAQKDAFYKLATPTEKVEITAREQDATKKQSYFDQLLPAEKKAYYTNAADTEKVGIIYREKDHAVKSAYLQLTPNATSLASLCQAACDYTNTQLKNPPSSGGQTWVNKNLAAKQCFANLLQPVLSLMNPLELNNLLAVVQNNGYEQTLVKEVTAFITAANKSPTSSSNDVSADNYDNFFGGYNP